MTAFRLILRSLVYYRRTHLGVIMGAAVSTAVLVGALLVNDSVRFSLEKMTLARLGRTQFAMAAGDRFFRSSLADSMAVPLKRDTAPILHLLGTATSPDNDTRVNKVEVMGVDDRFWTLGDTDITRGDGAVINRRLADRLELGAGDEIVLRVDKPGFLPRDDPFFSETLMSVALRITITAVADDSGFGRFSLRSNQVPPFNVFIPLSILSEKTGLAGRANVLLVGLGNDELPVERVSFAFKNNWKLPDASLELRELADGNGLELRSDRVFLDPSVAEAAMKAADSARGILTYLVNDISSGEKHCPYSFVSASGTPLVPANMADNEIIVNEWLAADLGLQPGASLSLTYYFQGPLRTLRENTSTFKVQSVVPISGPAADSELTPMFPGISDAKSCRDWDTGIAIDVGRIREKDGTYWDEYRGTPKAFVTLNAAQKMWGGRFGGLTGIRFAPESDSAKISSAILNELEPASLGFIFHDVRREGVRAGHESLDLSSYFIGLSFFIIIAALLLTGLLFVFSVEQRAEESGTLQALGFPHRRVRNLLLTEGIFLAGLGGALGSAGGIFYNKAILYGLGTVWHGAVGTSSLEFHARPVTILAGGLIGTVMAMLTMWLTIRKQALRSVRDLQSGVALEPAGTGKASRKTSLVFAVICAVSAVSIIASAGPGRGREAAGAFFMAGSLLLVTGIALFGLLFSLWSRPMSSGISLTIMGLRNCARRRGRSLTVIALLACGIFIVTAVGASRRDSAAHSELKESGTGGFAFYGETAVPILHDLNGDTMTKRLELDDNRYSSVRFTQMRVKEGDDASCLNLNRAQVPRVLAVCPEEMARRGSFTFIQKTQEAGDENPWLALNSYAGENVVAGIADQTVIQYGLGRKVGDTLDLVDERGRAFKIKLVASLANSIFQGSILVSEKSFLERYPSVSGTRVVLVDVPGERKSDISKLLSRNMRNSGLELTSAGKRLAEFNAVENTYLSIFFMLGALGVLLGSIGLGILVLRNIMERRGELAVLRATGFRRTVLYWLVFSEHGMLLAGGTVCGVVAALVAIMPALSAPGTDVPYWPLAIMLAAVIVNGLLWTGLATWAATRGDFLSALVNE